MFKNNIADEADFCEAYKSQILNGDAEEETSPLVSILIILFLLALIIALSIFGYNYITANNSSNSTASTPVMAISDEDLKVTEMEESPSSSVKSLQTKEILVKSFNELPKSKSVDINDLADKVKIDMSENEKKSISKETFIKSKDEEIIPSVNDSVKSTYVEDLAKLTAEIDKDRE